MKRVLLLTFWLAHTALAQTQRGVVRGTVRDSLTALSDATVSLTRAADSSLVSFTTTSARGSFEIKNLDTASYVLVVSYGGFQPLRKAFVISPATLQVNLGELQLHHAYKTLEEVIVKDGAPIKVNGDTVSFNANAFKTKPDATAEDLLKKLPGVQVDREGSVKAQGETVQKIYVDGKEFFGNDPKLATKNITADMIDEVQLYDDMSEQAKFNKIDDGNRSKAINLKLKKSKKRGLFGQASAGYGTNNRYSTNNRLNQFKDDRRISVFANANNTNRLGFSTTDLAGLSGGNGSKSNNNPVGGLITSAAAGLNYNNVWNKYLEIAGNYNYNHTSTDKARNNFRQNFFPTSNINEHRTSFSQSNSAVHRATMKLTYTINERNTLIYSPNLALQQTESNNTDSSTAFATANNTETKINQSKSLVLYKNESVNWSNNLIWRRTFAKAGRTLSATFSNTYARNTVNGFNRSHSADFDKAGNQLRDSLLNQQSNRKSNTDNLSAGLSYTEPIGQDKVWEVNYNYSDNKSTADRVTFDNNAVSQKYDLVNEALTNLFQNENTAHRVGSNFRVTKKKYNYQAGLAYASSLLQSNNRTKNQVLKQRFNNLFPTASFNYQFARSRSLRFSYRGATAQPSVSQLQPIQDVTNPRYIREGNPALAQEFRNAFSLIYNFFDAASLRNLFVALTFNNTSNKIVNSTQVIDSFGKQLLRPVNLSGAYNASCNFNFGVPIRGVTGSNLNFTTSASYNRDPSLLNGRKTFSNNLDLGEDVRLNYNYNEKLDLGVNAGVDYTAVRYTLQQRERYYTYSFGADATYLFGNGFILSSEFDFMANTGRSSGFNKNRALWNAAFAKTLFKNKRGELRASVFDLLNASNSVVRTVGETFIEDGETTVLKRFAMLSFTYKLNKMGGSKTQKPGGGMLGKERFR